MTGDPDPESERLEARLVGRLHAMVLHELQTRGGLGVDLDSRGETAAAQAEVAVIHRLVETIRTDRSLAPVRAARALATRRPRRVLDVGAGLAPWSLALARAAPDAHVVAVDLPPQIDSLADAVASAGLSSRFDVRAADAFQDDLSFGQRHDLVLLANVCHLFAPRETRSLVGRLASTLATGGTLAIIDQVLDESPDWRLWAALYAVGLPHTMPGGHLHGLRQYAAWMESAGLTAEDPVPLSAPPCHLLVMGSRAG